MYLDEQIRQSPVGANGLIFLPYLLGERAPRWNPDAKGAWIGLKPETATGDLLRSALEGITMNLSICLDILRTQVEIEELLVIGGGAQNAIWRQMMADIFGVRVKAPGVLEEAGSMGAAVIGGVGAGIFQDFTAIDRFLSIKEEHSPNPEAKKAYEPIKELFDDCYFALESIYQKMARRR